VSRPGGDLTRRRITRRPAEPRFLTTRQCAARLGVTVNALKAWIRAERLPALRTPGGHHRIAEADLLAFKARLSVAGPRVAPRVLLVDDEEEVLAVLKETLLEAMPEARVECATDGYEALVLVGAFRPHLLVLDLRMPRLDGFAVCRQLKARADTRDIRILAVTGHPEGGARERILECGADGFLDKPFRPAEICERLFGLLPTGVGRP
jgi:excisionase family DNA binding protein